MFHGPEAGCPGRSTLLCCALLALAGLLGACAHRATPAPISWDQVLALPRPPADRVLAYGPAAQQYGQLRLPPGAGPFPVVVLIHGGCWLNQYDLHYLANAAGALQAAGIATWSIEYRRIGDPGGGWPGTLLDVGNAVDHLVDLAGEYALDLDRVVLVGHSAGGHLALWAAGRAMQPPDSPLAASSPLRPRGVVSLAGIADLALYAAGAGNCNAAAGQLMGGLPAEHPARYRLADPAQRVPLGVPVDLLSGELDSIVPPAQARRYAALARPAGDQARVILLPGAGHFDLVAPPGPAWAQVLSSIRAMIGGTRGAP